MEKLSSPCRMMDQVGGHLFSDGKLGMLTVPGKIWKPMEGDERGKRELSFYKHFQDKQPKCMPKFFGTKKHGDLEYMELEDLREGMEFPCVMDLKVGKHCYTPYHGKTKIESEMQKYALQSKIGFRCAGLRVVGDLGQVKIRDRHWGRSLKETNVDLLFEEFFYDGKKLRLDQAKVCLAQLREMIDFVKTSLFWELYACSVLFLRDNGGNGGAKVAMIDFSYVYQVEQAGHPNFLFGLERLESELSQWIEKREKLKITTLLFVLRDEEILLAMKNRGFGVGKYNGVGGKVEKEETVDEACVRECHEEVGILIDDVSKLEKRGVIYFYYTKESWDTECHIYTAKYEEKWGIPKESEEMTPAWVKLSEIPFDKMWSDDSIWMPHLLKGEDIFYRFWIDHETSKITKHQKSLNKD